MASSHSLDFYLDTVPIRLNVVCVYSTAIYKLNRMVHTAVTLYRV